MVKVACPKTASITAGSCSQFLPALQTKLPLKSFWRVFVQTWRHTTSMTTAEAGFLLHTEWGWVRGCSKRLFESTALQSWSSSYGNTQTEHIYLCKNYFWLDVISILFPCTHMSSDLSSNNVQIFIS